MKSTNPMKRILSALLVFVMVLTLVPVHAHAAEASDALIASLEKAKTYTDNITINNSSNDPATVVQNFGTHFTWDNEKRENGKSYLFDWSYYNGVVFEGIEYLYEVTGDTVYKDYVVEYMSSLITSKGTWATCTNNTSKQAAGYNATHGADCYKTASLLLDAYEMTGDSRYLTMAATLYADLDTAAKSYSLSKAGNNFRHTWASDPSPDLWLDGLYMILPFRAEYAKYIGDTEELDLIVSRMQWVSDNMYNSSKGLFYHAADSASSNSGTYWLRSIGWYAAAIVDIMDSMEGENLEIMKAQLVKLVDGMKACQNASNGMWLNNMNASQSSSNPYETSGTALTCYAVMKAVNNGWLDESYADMAILAFNGICSEKLSGNTLTDICFKGAPGSSNSTFYDNEGKGVGPFIMFYAEVLEYVNAQNAEPEVPEVTDPTEPEATEPEATEPEATEPEATEPEATEPEATEPEEEETVFQGFGNLEADAVYTLDSDGINSGEKYLIIYNGRALENKNGIDNNPTVSISNNTITLSDDSTLAWTITKSSGSNYYVENNGSYVNLSSSGNDPIGTNATVYITGSGTYKFRNASGSGAYLRYSSSQLWCAGTNGSNNSLYLYRRTGSGTGDAVVFSMSPAANQIKPGSTLALNGAVTVGGQSVSLSSCTIAWSSSNNDCATVSGGVVTGVSSGNVTITATLSAVNGTSLKEIIVLNVPVSVQGHSYESVVTAPTCTEGGYTTYTCTTCGHSYTADETTALGHSYETVVTAPTCTEGGYTTYTCACGDTYVADEMAALGHTYAAVTVNASCAKDGYTTYTCACGDTYTVVIPATGEHVYVTETVEATCTENGSVIYTCDCGDSYEEVIPATGHSYQAVATAPTCENAGYTTYTCACGDSYVADEVAALGHAYEAVVTAPTCTGKGYTTYTCGNCGDSYIADEIAALGHSYQAVVTAPTCETTGYTTYTCACGHSYVADQVAALGHDYETVTVEATCETDGSATTTCAICGKTTVEVIPALGHDYETVVTDATCTEEGSVVRACTNCGDSDTQIIPAIGHNYETVTVEAGCTTDGSVTTTCTVCGDANVEVIPALGHSYHAVVTAPTCETAGYTTYTCDNCGDVYVADQVAALGHSYHAVVTAPTCETAGYTTYTCDNCGDVYVADQVAALGHSYHAVVTAPTCETAGYTTYTCACGDTYVADRTAALGHSYSTAEVDGYLVYTCDHCGDSYSEKLAVDLSYDKVTKFANGDSYVITLYSNRKYYALSHEDNKISLVQVTVSNNEITSEITEDLLWTYENSKLSYEDGDDTYYLYVSTSNSWWGGWFGWGGTNTLTVSTSNSSSVSFSSSKLKVGSYYLRYSSGSVKLDSRSTTTYLFQENEN